MSEETTNNDVEVSKTWTRFVPTLALLVIVAMALDILYSIAVRPDPLLVFGIFNTLLLTDMAMLLAGLVILVWGLFAKRAELKANGGKTMGVAAIPLIIGLINSGQGLNAPGIHDITTDMDNPPEFVAAALLRTAEENPPEYMGKEVADIQP